MEKWCLGGVLYLFEMYMVKTLKRKPVVSSVNATSNICTIYQIEFLKLIVFKISNDVLTL